MSISTHVLDAVTGRPAAGMVVGLERWNGVEWEPLASRDTDGDGRVPDLATDTPAGRYRLTFDVEGWAGADSFYPEVMVGFRLTDPGAHHHIPLLLSPFAYSTYRGS
jgi:5-hydroxyisourate hydrolase